MFKNYLRIALRSLLKNRVFSFITVFGLSIGIAAFLFIIHYVRFERSYEDFNENSANIVRMTLDLYKGSEYIVTDCETHAPMAPLVKQKFPEVVDFVRMFHCDGLQELQIGREKFLEEGIYFADQSALSIFSINILHGDAATALTDPFATVISKSIAEKFYGKEDAVGSLIKIDDHDYHITGVMEDIAPNTHLKFKILLSHATLQKTNKWYNEVDYNGNNEYTYLQLVPGTDLKAFNKKLFALSVELKDKLATSRYTVQPMRDIHLYSNKTFEPEVNGNARVVYFLLIIAGFIIMIAWVNYVNLSTSRAMERAREVGIRKVMGSLKSQLIRQFMAESMLINALAGVFALIIFYFMLPAFRDVSGQPLPLNAFRDPIFWSIFGGILLMGSILSGIYPAFVLSSFQPAAVLKGKFQSSGHGQILRKSLVVFQFGATVVLIICMSTVYLQVKFLRHYDLGMTIEQTLSVRAPRLNGSDSVFRTSYRALKSELQKNSFVERIARSGSLPGLSLHELSTTGVARFGQDRNTEGYEFYYFSIDADFIATMNMRLVAGRNFEPGVKNEDQVIVNEEAVSRLGFKTPEEALGTQVTFQTRWPGEASRIIGVVKNFYQRSPKEAHIPMLFNFNEDADYFSIKLKTSDMPGAVAAVQKTWKAIYPGAVFSYFFLDDNYSKQFQSDAQFGKVMAIFSALAVFIACLGLFGLSSYTIALRTKEIGIRKVLGASVSQVVTLLSRDFIKVVLLASVLAMPVAYLAMKEWLSNYSVRVGMNVWLFIMPVVVILLIALLTVSFQTVRTAIANPVNSLKQE